MIISLSGALVGFRGLMLGIFRRPGSRELELDAVRGIAILLAVGWHFNQYTGTPIDVLLAPGAWIGWAGVDLFFVLSGFLVGRLVLKEIASTGAFDFRTFFGRRALRLWPVLYVFIAAQLVLGDKPWNSYVFQVLFHVQNYAKTPIDHLWSLAVEEHFYLVIGLLLPSLAARKVSPRTLVQGLFGVCLAALAFRSLAVLSGVDTVSIQWETHFRMDALAFGVALAVVAVHFPTQFEQILRHRTVWATFAVAGFVTLALARDHPTFRATAGYTLAYLASAALMLAVYRLPTARWSWLAGPLGFLGIYSYSLYIWHNAIGGKAGDALARFGVDTPWLVVGVKYAAAILGACLVTHAVERPGLALRDRLFPHRKPQTVKLAA